MLNELCRFSGDRIYPLVPGGRKDYCLVRSTNQTSCEENVFMVYIYIYSELEFFEKDEF